MIFKRDILALDIGNYQIKAVVGKYQKGEIHLSRVFTIPTPNKVLQDGEILDIGGLKTAIEKELKEQNIKTKRVVYSLQSTTVITREVDLPSLEEEELEKMLQYEVQQFFPTSLEEYVIQYKRLKIIEDQQKKTRLLVAALPKMIVQNYMALSKALNLRPLALDIHSNSLSKLFMKGIKVDDLDFKDKTLAVIDLGYEGININIIKEGILEFSRLLPFGGRDIDEALSRTFDLPLIEAEKRKKTYEDALDSAVIEELTYSCIENWSEEIQRIFKYHTSRNIGNRIDQIYLMGGHANLRGIDSRLAEYFNIPTKRITNLSNVKLNLHRQQLETLDLKCYLNAIGAIIRR